MIIGANQNNFFGILEKYGKPIYTLIGAKYCIVFMDFKPEAVYKIYIKARATNIVVIVLSFMSLDSTTHMYLIPAKKIIEIRIK